LTLCAIVYFADKIPVWNGDVRWDSGTFCVHYCEHKVLRWICIHWKI